MTRDMKAVYKEKSNLIGHIRRAIKVAAAGRLLSPAAVICLGLLCGLYASTAMADLTRHCDAEVRIVQHGTPHAAIYNFSVHSTINKSSSAFGNRARRTARARIKRCMQDHWSVRDSSTPPRSCLDDDRTDVINYPFNNLHEDIIQAVCPEIRPGADNVTKHIDVSLNISGRTHCRLDAADSNIHIADDVAIVCPHTEVTLERIEEPASGGSASGGTHEQPVIGDGGGWGCVGAGCGGSGSATEEEPPVEEAEPAVEEHPADDGLPATASYNLLPFMRLPGNDLRLIEMSSPNWMLCRQACTDDARCRAYTYRAPNANSGPVCLLKSGTGMRIPDTCCQSGVKR